MMGYEKIRIVACPVDRPPYITFISNTLENMQRFIGGYIEAVNLSTDCVVICDEEGRLKGLPENPSAVPGLVGDVFYVGVKGDEFTDLDVDHARELLRMSKNRYGKNHDTAAVSG